MKTDEQNQGDESSWITLNQKSQVDFENLNFHKKERKI